jgi:exodeoxyribonuclease-3
METTTLLALNIRRSGGERLEEMLEAMPRPNPDVVVFTEFRGNEWGVGLRAALRERGYTHQACSGGGGRGASVLLVSKWGFEPRPLPGPCDAFSDRLLLAEFPSLTVLAACFPVDRKKLHLFRALLAESRGLVASPSVLIGNFNTGRHLVDEEGETFEASGLFSRLEESGWVDAWRALHPNEREYSWYGHGGNGYRIDHAFISRPWRGRLVRTEYIQSFRLEGLSDHAGLLVEISGNAGMGELTESLAC